MSTLVTFIQNCTKVIARETRQEKKKRKHQMEKKKLNATQRRHDLGHKKKKIRRNPHTQNN